MNVLVNCISSNQLGRNQSSVGISIQLFQTPKLMKEKLTCDVLRRNNLSQLIRYTSVAQPQRPSGHDNTKKARPALAILSSTLKQLTTIATHAMMPTRQHNPSIQRKAQGTTKIAGSTAAAQQNTKVALQLPRMENNRQHCSHQN